MTQLMSDEYQSCKGQKYKFSIQASNSCDIGKDYNCMFFVLPSHCTFLEASVVVQRKIERSAEKGKKFNRRIYFELNERHLHLIESFII